MTRAHAAGCLGAATLLVATVGSAQAAGEEREAWVAELLTTVRALEPAEADVRALCAEPLPSGVTCSPSQTTRPCTLADRAPGQCTAPAFTVSFDSPLAARPLVRALRIRSPRIISTDVHQRSWSIVGTRAFRGSRRASVPVTVGVWRVRVHVSERPSGRPPRERVGASSAHRVRASTQVSALSFDLAPTPER